MRSSLLLLLLLLSHFSRVRLCATPQTAAHQAPPSLALLPNPWQTLIFRTVSIVSPLSECHGEGNGTPLQYSCLENPMDGGAWWAAVHGVAKGRT